MIAEGTAIDVLEYVSASSLRGLLFLAALCAAWAWTNRRKGLAIAFIFCGSALGLGFSLVQLRAPIGFGTDEAATKLWAQVGINAAGVAAGSGFVAETPEDRSLPSRLAAAGLPARWLFRLPQVSVLLALFLLGCLPLLCLKRPSAVFGACLVLAGGLWPGLQPYGLFLVKPEAVLWLASGIVGLALLWRARPRWIEPRRLRGAAALAILAALGNAASQSLTAHSLVALTLALATMLVADRLRAFLRKSGGSASRGRRLEALCLAVVFVGSGVFWFDPVQTVAGFESAREPVGALRRPLEWIRGNIPSDEVVVTHPTYSAIVAIYGGHRVLLPPADMSSDLRRPAQRARLMESVAKGRPIERLAKSFGATHLFLGPGEPSPVPAPGDVAPEPVLTLDLVYQDAEDFRIFRFVRNP